MGNDNRELILSMDQIDVVFPGVHALKGCNFELRRGEVHALIGENGAGKSTLMKVLTGINTSYLGQITLDGKPVHFNNVKEAQEHGIAIVHQELNLLNYLTVAQNIYIGRESNSFFFSDRALNKRAGELLKHLNIDLDPATPVKDLTVGKQQMVEIAKAMSYDNTKIMILDEPTAALSEKETQELFVLMRDMRDRGIGLVFISHRMNELKQISDRITVMRDGEYIGTLDAATCEMDEIIRMMVGREITQDIKTKSNVPDDAPVVLEARNLNSPQVHNVSFKLRKGEILGFSGLVGAGRTETMRLVFGADPRFSGEVLINGQPVDVKTPKDAVKSSVGYLSEDRKRYGVILGMSVKDNIVIGSLDELQKGPLLDMSGTAGIADKYINDLRIKTPSRNQFVKFLSGGNQQKVVIAKWLMMNTDVLIFDEPTRGIDVGAKAEIYNLMNDLVAMGKSIIMISSELPEILRMSDRIIVMCEGRITGEVDIAEATQENIMYLSTKHNEEETAS